MTGLSAHTLNYPHKTGVSRGACGGCFGYIPPQTQSEIRTKKTIMICEHCGRIIADIDDSAVFISDEEMAS